MESKREQDHRTRRCCQWLLIEPVWNRNIEQVAVLRGYEGLLIEPVWNRNQILRVQLSVQQHLLLIEPVWNRNC